MALPFALPARLIELPDLSLRFVPVWQRNLLVWRKLAFASILGNIADPLLYMLALGYDFFTYFFTLVITPMLLFSGVYFPVDQMPAWLATVASALPLKHAIDIARPLMLGQVPSNVSVHVAVLLAYSFAAYYVAVMLTRRRLLK